MSDVRKNLEYLEENLDLQHINTVKARLKGSMCYNEPDRIPIKVSFSGGDFPYYPYSEAFNDMEKMLTNELTPICRSTMIKDDSLPCIRANYGVGILPSVFGAGIRIIGNNMPWVEHLPSVEDIKKLITMGIPDFRNGLGQRVIETHEFYRDVLAGYPKCRAAIPIYHPDLQGPFDVAHLLWGSDIYYALYDEPELVHELLELVTQTYILFLKKLRKEIDDLEDGFIYHWSTLYKGGVVLRNDSAVNISREMYEEFVKPYDEKIFKAFGSGSMHYCGRADHWVFSMLESEGLEALNFGQPPNLVFGIEFLSKVYQKAKERKVSILEYDLGSSWLDKLKETDLTEGVTYRAWTNTADEAKALIENCELKPENPNKASINHMLH